jgi:uncharacterized protein (DUF2267 family)
MTSTAVPPFESTIHTTNAWVKELLDELGWQDRHRAYQALRAVLHALRDRLTVEETADLGAQLPMLVRGLYYEGWRPAGKPVKGHNREEFLAPIAAAFRDEPDIFPEEVVWGVLKVLQRHVSAGEIADVKHIVPKFVRSLWPEREIGTTF